MTKAKVSHTGSDVALVNKICPGWLLLGQPVRMSRASAAFGRLQERMWKNRHVSIWVKGKVYQAIVLSSLLYGAEIWMVYKDQLDKLRAYMMRQLRQIMNITLFDKIRNEEILWRAGLSFMIEMLIDRNL